MNSLRNDTKQKKNNESIFTVETFGVILMLFSALCLVCVISYDKVFSLPGKFVCEFLVGLFGYMSIAVCIFTFIFGLLLLLGKKTTLSLKTKAMITLDMVLLCLLLNVISLRDFSALPYGEYLSKAYALGEGGLDGATCGGIALSLVSYFFSYILTNVGAYVVVSILLAVSIALQFKSIYEGGKTPKSENTNFKSSYIANNVNGVPDPSELEEMSYPVSDITFEEEKPSSQRLFVNNPENFELKTKRDLKRENNNAIKIDYEKNGLAVGGSSLNMQQAKEIEQKINYIKTPATIQINKDIISNSSENNDIRISKPIKDFYTDIPKDIEEKKVESFNSDSTEEKIIPFIEHDEQSKIESASDHAVEFSDKYADIPDEDVKGVTIAPSVAPTEPTRDFSKNTFEHYDVPLPNEQSAEIIEEKKVDFDNVSDIKADKYVVSQKEEPFEPIKEEIEPPVSNIRETSRSLFGDAKKDSTLNDNVESKNINSNILSNDRRNIGFGERATSSFNEKPKADFSSRENAVEEKKVEEKPKKDPPPINRVYHRPPLDLLERHNQVVNSEAENHNGRMDVIKQTLEEFHINAEPQSYVQGPSVTRYEIKMPAGVSVKKVLTLDDDLRMRLASKNGIRIEAPIPGKNLVGIEVANNIKETVGLREVLEQASKKPQKSNALMFALGKNIVGDAIMDNLAKAPHYLIAGATGSGKSVCLNVMIISMIMKYSPEELRLILVDPKSVGFRIYEHLPHLMIDEIITEPQKTLATLQWAYVEMERRYNVFTECEQLIMDFDAYNERIASSTVAKMPRIVIVIDELADLMETCKKEMESKIRALAQKSRAAGIHLVLATQRPSVDIITGTIKVNLPSRIALKVMNFADSNTILAEGGAEKLLGNGDMLYKNSSMAEFERVQGAWLTDLEITNIVNYIKENNKAYFDDELSEYLEKSLHPKQDETAATMSDGGEDSIENDDIFRRSLALGISMGAISISMIQRRFSVGFSRAGRIVDALEKLGYIGANEGNSKGRKVLLSKEEFESRYGEMPD